MMMICENLKSELKSFCGEIARPKYHVISGTLTIKRKGRFCNILLRVVL